jgi:heavy metal translocating P-type ATPase
MRRFGDPDAADRDADTAKTTGKNPLACGESRGRTSAIAVLSAAAILAHVGLRFGAHASSTAANGPLWIALGAGGGPLVYGLARKILRAQFGSDFLAGLSILTAALLGEYLAGAIIVLMLSGGEALESYALERASSGLAALAARMPSIGHRRQGTTTVDVPLSEIAVDDLLVVFPHETCPVDGTVTEGRGAMDESYLTGEPFQMIKTIGSAVLSGSINGEAALTIRATRRAVDSRYAKIMEVMRESEARRPRLRRLGDQLGAWYTPLAFLIAVVAWAASGNSTRFLAVLVIATPCPLLIAIPVAVIGSISRCARRAIIVRNPVALEVISECRTAIFDKTGTLTYGEPALTAEVMTAGFDGADVLGLVASLERYSRHPLARAVVAGARTRNLTLVEATEVSELPGQGLRGLVTGRRVLVTSRARAEALHLPGAAPLPPAVGGLECAVVIDDQLAGLLRFRDAPRSDSRSFVTHLGPLHRFGRAMIISGDRESEVRHLAEYVGIHEIYAAQTPEGKLAIVRRETAAARTLYVGDGINDAPAMMAATVSIAIGHASDVTSQAASVVIMDSSLTKVDEFMHISRRMRTIALQSAVGGMALSLAGMLVAATGHLDPVQGAISQEAIDVLAVVNALRAAWAPTPVHDL